MVLTATAYQTGHTSSHQFFDLVRSLLIVHRCSIIKATRHARIPDCGGLVSIGRPVSMGMDEDESLGASNPHALAMQWIAAWNSRNLDAILSHYSDSVEVGKVCIASCIA